MTASLKDLPRQEGPGYSLNENDLSRIPTTMMDMVTLILACSLYPNNALPYAMIQTSSAGNPLTVRTLHAQKSFKKVSEAVTYTQDALEHGEPVWVGIMQLSSRWFTQQQPKISLAELFEPCKNVVVATSVLNQLALRCQTEIKKIPDLNLTECLLSQYETGHTYTDTAYAVRVLTYVKNHSFTQLVEKARDPGMVAAVAHVKPPVTVPQTRVATAPQKNTQASAVS
jgi:Transglycosylase SLT domain